MLTIVLHTVFLSRLWILLFSFACFPSISGTSYLQTGSQNSASGQDIDVIHYLLHLKIPDVYDPYIQGHTDIQIIATRENLTRVYLDLLSMQVDSVWFNEEIVEGFTYNGQLLFIPLPYSVEKNTSFMVTVFYRGKPAIDPRWGGFYFKEGTAYNMGVGMGSTPPTFGRAWFPCVDNFTDRASYEYFIEVEDQLTAVCSGELLEVIDHPGPDRTFHWKLDEPVPTYLSSVAVSDYVALESVISGTEREIPVSIYVKPTDSLKAIKSFKSLPLIMEAFEHYFGPYSWPRIGYVSVPFSGGAMEHACNIALSASTITGDDKYRLLYAHELAHSWVGNQVTCATAEDMWLNEGWATYAEALFLEYAMGRKAFKDYVRGNHYRVLQQAHLRDEGYYPVYGIPEEITYGTTVYDKGADMVHTLRGFMGDGLFFRTLREYLRQYAFQSVTTREMERFFSEYSRTDLMPFFNAWIYTEGFPVFTIDSMHIIHEGSRYRTGIYVGQRLRGRKLFTLDNRIEVLFVDRYMNRIKRTVKFAGNKTYQEFKLPFSPVAAWLDPEEKISDAVTDQLIMIRDRGRYELPEENMVVEVLDMTDSLLLRPSLIWIEPEGTEMEGYIAGDRYWDVQWVSTGNCVMKGSFFIDQYFSFGETFFGQMKKSPGTESISLLYRKDAGEAWTSISFEKKAMGHSLVVMPRELKPGHYAVTVRQEKTGGIK